MTRTIERRDFRTEFETRATETTLTFGGYAAVFDSESHGEVVKPGAFNRTIAHGHDVRLLVNHDGVPLARTTSGTLTLAVDDHGLRAEAELDRSNPAVQEIASAMSRGDIDQMSFAFAALDEETVDGVRELREVRLYDVSVVTYPWYEATSAELNSLDLALTALHRGAELTVEQRSLILDRITEPQEPCEEDAGVVGIPRRLTHARFLFPAR